MTGLTKVLKEVFFPDFEMTKPWKKLYPSDSMVKKKASKDPNNLGLQLGSQVRGNMVHDQIRTLCDPELSKDFGKKYAYIDEWTKLAISWMKVNGYEPYANELAIADPSLGIATAIDAIVFHEETGKYAMVEWKTGSIDYFYYSTNNSCRYIADLDNSLHNQARLQILMTNYILKENYKKSGIVIDKLFVVHVGDQGLHENVVSRDFMSMEVNLYNAMLKHRANC